MKMRGRRALALAWAAVLVGGFQTRSLAASSTKPARDTLRLAVEADPRSLDPVRAFSNEEGTLSRFVFDTLLEAGVDGQFRPVLAESLPEISSDGLTYTFRLHPGVRFSNGQPLTSIEVVKSFERIFNPVHGALLTVYFKNLLGAAEFESARKREQQDPGRDARGKGERWIEPVALAGVESMDPLTFRFRLKQPDLAFLHVLGTPAGGIARVDASWDGKRSPIPLAGTGAYRIRRWVPGAALRFEQNPHSFRTVSKPFRGIDVLINVHRTTQAMMFERGELDFLYFLADQDFIRFRRNPSLRSLLRVVRGTTPTYVVMNCEMGPFTNRLVRVALNHAVDRQGLMKVLSHRGQPQRGPLPLVVSGFNRGLPEYSYDPVLARRLLAEAGFPNGFATQLWAPQENPVWMKSALFVQQNLREIGVEARIHSVSFAALNDSVGRRRTVPLSMYNWVTIADDPKETLDCLLNGDNITEQACMNTSFYSNLDVQELFRQADREVNPAQRISHYQSIERQVVRDAPWIFLIQLDHEMAVQPWLRGFEFRGFWPPARLEACSFEGSTEARRP